LAGFGESVKDRKKEAFASFKIKIN